MEKSGKASIMSHFSPSKESFVILYLVLHFSGDFISVYDFILHFP